MHRRVHGDWRLSWLLHRLDTECGVEGLKPPSESPKDIPKGGKEGDSLLSQKVSYNKDKDTKCGDKSL